MRIEGRGRHLHRPLRRLRAERDVRTGAVGFAPPVPPQRFAAAAPIATASGFSFTRPPPVVGIDPTPSKEGTMKPTSRQLVYRVVAARAGIGPSLVDDQDSVDDLGLDELDVILMAAQIGALADLRDECPWHALSQARTVGDLVALVDTWRAREESGSRRSTGSAVDRMPMNARGAAPARERCRANGATRSRRRRSTSTTFPGAPARGCWRRSGTLARWRRPRSRRRLRGVDGGALPRPGRTFRLATPQRTGCLRRLELPGLGGLAELIREVREELRLGAARLARRVLEGRRELAPPPP